LRFGSAPDCVVRHEHAPRLAMPVRRAHTLSVALVDGALTVTPADGCHVHHFDPRRGDVRAPTPLTFDVASAPTFGPSADLHVRVERVDARPVRDRLRRVGPLLVDDPPDDAWFVRRAFVTPGPLLPFGGAVHTALVARGIDAVRACDMLASAGSLLPPPIERRVDSLVACAPDDASVSLVELAHALDATGESLADDLVCAAVEIVARQAHDIGCADVTSVRVRLSDGAPLLPRYALRANGGPSAHGIAQLVRHATFARVEDLASEGPSVERLLERLRARHALSSTDVLAQLRSLVHALFPSRVRDQAAFAEEAACVTPADVPAWRPPEDEDYDDTGF
jgi:hypothetical protein